MSKRMTKSEQLVLYDENHFMSRNKPSFASNLIFDDKFKSNTLLQIVFWTIPCFVGNKTCDVAMLLHNLSVCNKLQQLFLSDTSWPQNSTFGGDISDKNYTIVQQNIQFNSNAPQQETTGSFIKQISTKKGAFGWYIFHFTSALVGCVVEACIASVLW